MEQHMKSTFKSSLSKDNNRGSWCVIFRHPLKQNDDGSTGRRVRRGLGTTDKGEAQALVEQLNNLLADEEMWNPSLREKAATIYPEQIVRAFYDDLAPGVQDHWSVRNEFIPLPGKEDGYAKALLLGTTGAGKTTLLRQCIGTKPPKERFPSTSTAKTTVCDIEIVLADSPFKAVITFFPRELIRLYVEECVTAAAVSRACFKADRNEVARKFLEHSEQRFRLSYILGTLQTEEELEDEDDDKEDDLPGLSEAERTKLEEKLVKYLEEIEALAEAIAPELADELTFSRESSTNEDADAFQQLFESRIRLDDDFHDLLDRIMDDIEIRFAPLEKAGDLKQDRTGWPSCWQFQTGERDDFITTVSQFTSNYAPTFGRLLTPLVEGIRVSGPFKPNWSESQPKLVLMDGEGLGHTPDSASSISTKVTKRFELADAIVLVDSAKQPMQAAPIALLRSLVASGHASKLIIAFTHFDQVKADNMRGTAERKVHVRGSVDNALAAIAKTWGLSAANLLKRSIDPRTFFLAGIQSPIKETAHHTREQLQNFVDAITATILPPPPTNVVPWYEFSDLWPRIQQASRDFRQPWRARLRLGYYQSVQPEHWTRIKALTRRLAQFGRDEYMDLRPVADFIASLSIEISRFIANPSVWQPGHAPEEMRQAVVDKISQEFSSRLHLLAQQKLFLEKLKVWTNAYDESGTGSASRRARAIDGIYDDAAPLLSESENIRPAEFVKEIRKLLEEAIIAGGGQIVTPPQPTE